MGLLLVPFIHISVYLFRTMHPMPILMKPSKPSLPPEMLKTLLVSFGVATLLYVGFVMVRYGMALRRYDREEAQHES
jgi:heme exporter protein C